MASKITVRRVCVVVVCLFSSDVVADLPWELRYIGSFRLPAVQEMDSRFSHGARSLALHQSGVTMWVQGHEHHQLIAEVRIPERLVRSQDPKELPIAEVVTPFLDVTRGRRKGQLGGVAIDPTTRRFWWTLEQFYDVSAKAYPSIGSTSISLKESQGPWMCDVGNKPTERYITLAPRGLADRKFGGRFLICGQAGVSGTVGSSQGPCAVAVEAPRGRPQQKLSTIKLLFYPEERKFRDDRGEWKRADKVWSGAWIDDGQQHWLAFSALVGTGWSWYGKPDEPPDGAIVDRWRGAKGYHAPPYEERLYVYAVDDLLRVARGEIRSWQPVPVKVFDLRPALIRPGHAVVALAYDAKRRRLYLSEHAGDATQSEFEKMPVVHAYDLADRGEPSAAVAASSRETSQAVSGSD